MEYGNYLVGMSMTKDRSFDLNIPEGFSAATNLVTKGKVNSKVISVAPRTTVVLYRKWAGLADYAPVNNKVKSLFIIQLFGGYALQKPPI